MFPDRIDRMILDGAVNPHDYYNGWYYAPLSHPFVFSTTDQEQLG